MRIGERLSGLPFSPAQQRARKAKRTRIAQEGKEVASYVVRVKPGKSGYFATLCSASHFASARLQAYVAKNDASRRTQDSPAAGMCSEDERGGVFDPGACPDRLGEVRGMRALVRQTGHFFAADPSFEDEMCIAGGVPIEPHFASSLNLPSPNQPRAEFGVFSNSYSVCACAVGGGQFL